MADLPTQSSAPQVLAQSNWDRYRYALRRGHRDYAKAAKRNEDMYLGGGLQWLPEDRAKLESEKRPAYEFNEILPAVNTALGYQIHNRMDIAFAPRSGEATQQLAEMRSKVAMQIADQNKLHWRETQVFADGLIQQRGYFDVRLDFSDSIEGEIKIVTLDPLDVLPDPDAKGYDPDEWSDVTITRWLTYDEIEQLYGKQARASVENTVIDESDWGDHDDDVPRGKFGDANSGYAFDAFYADGLVRRARVVDRQRWVFELTPVALWPDTGDIRPTDGLSPEHMAQLQQQGWVFTRRMMRRVRWTVSTAYVVLFDDYSPYEHFTVVPYFAYFRRGRTRGMVDNAVGPQEAINKAVSQFVHIVNSAANSGWNVEENSLANMTTDELENQGAKTGLVIEHKKGTRPPEKIQPNQVPTGIDRFIDRATMALKDVTVPDAMRGTPGQEIAGVAIQSKQFASQQQLALPLDNLAHTRHLLAGRLDSIISRYYSAQREFRITRTDPVTGKLVTESLTVNQFDPATGAYLNDLTAGEYDVVVTEQPMQVTFENSQFEQALELRKTGVAIPDYVVVKHSNLTDKAEILSDMAAAPQQTNPVEDAKAKLLTAQADKIQAETVATGVQSLFSATQSANLLAAVPQLAGMADQMLLSAGFQDKDNPPIIAPPPANAVPVPMPKNTNPLTPAHADVGMDTGIEGGKP